MAEIRAQARNAITLTQIKTHTGTNHKEKREDDV